MKLQIFLLTLGIVASAGAVDAQLNRSSGGATTSTSISVSQPAPAQLVTTLSTGLLSGAKPSITGITASGENDD